MGPLVGSVGAQEVVPDGGREKSVRIVRAAAPPVIDGVLDEEAWRLAAQLEDLHEIQPTEYAPASERTVVYLMYDADAIYIAARLYDREPGEITARILRQGERVFGDDWFSVLLDPFNDKRSGYRFQTNANGLRQEALFQNISDEQWDWQGIWYTASTIDDRGWVAEMAIPFKTLSFDPNNDTWGINFRRAIARRDERTGWVSRNRNSDPSTSGIVIGLEGLEQGLGLDVVPSVSVSRRRPFDGTATTSDTDPSLDVFYKATPGLTTALTINTDFSATEVDDRQINLTRFGLFFPEKRDFFLQDADIFEFGGLGQNGRPFFSRRIGLSNEGEPIDLEVGGKVTGRIGRFNIGVLSVRQDGIGGALPADNATVGRVSANLLEESSVGMILTEGNPGVGVDNSLAGVDFLYRNSRLPGGRLVEVSAWMQESDTEGETRDQGAYGVRVGMPNNSGWRGGLGFTKLGEAFEPGLGFLNRPGIREADFGAQYTHRPREGWLRSISSGFDAERTEGLDGELESQSVSYGLIGLESRFGDEIEVEIEAEQDVLDEDFEISDGVIVPQAHYSFRNASVEFETADQRRVWGGVGFQTGDFYGGDRREIAAEINWRPSGRFRTGLGYEWNDIDLPGGSFVTRLASFTTEVAFSAKLSWVTRIQYDNDSDRVGVNLRLHWIPQAGREAFLVINHDLLRDFDSNLDDRFHSEVNDAVVKYSYTFRF
ncbi:MAG TPA: DUF5916 domain-containing protein [Gammaproteobacteria bacterium]|nr:DUF5916 domain-containing protein [Gammaproteobacteria bacterium]